MSRSAEPTVSFSMRLPKRLHDRLLDICGAAGCELTRSGLIMEAVTLFIAMLDARPSMLPGYDPERDRSARRIKRARRKKEQCKTEEGK